MQWNLIKLKVDRKLNQTKMAEIAGISQSSYQMKERGEVQFRANEMLRIARYFNTPMDDIFLPTDCTSDAV